MPNWNDVLKEIDKTGMEAQTKLGQAIDFTRRKYLKKLHNGTGRNVIAYYSSWLQKPLPVGSRNLYNLGCMLLMTIKMDL